MSHDVYVYDLGRAAGILIREVVPLPGTGAPTAFQERAAADVTGNTIWGASVVASRFVAENTHLFAGKRVLELGSGCGLLGMVLARLGVAASLTLSDYQSATVTNLGVNCTLNGVPVGAGVEGGGSVSICRMDWDKGDTWPKETAGEGGEGAGAASADAEASPIDPDDIIDPSHASSLGLATFDVLIASDCTYKKTYARKLASVVRCLLRPGGVFIYASPVAREGFAPLEGLLEKRAGCSLVQTVDAPPEWRISPLRGPEGEAPTLPLGWADGSSEGSGGGAHHVRLVSEEDAGAMFPELRMPGYPIVVQVYRRRGGEE